MFKPWKKPASPAAPVETTLVAVQPLAYRRFLRSIFQAPVRLNLAGQMHQARLLDLSLKGALVDMGQTPSCRVGARGRLRLLLSPTTFIAMDVAVTRMQGSQLGLGCTHIDLDSVTHLRHLIEQNAQDPALLSRELAVLIGSA
jgi:hypothetical protein